MYKRSEERLTEFQIGEWNCGSVVANVAEDTTD
jgi:hypothetical protein